MLIETKFGYTVDTDDFEESIDDIILDNFDEEEAQEVDDNNESLLDIEDAKKNVEENPDDYDAYSRLITISMLYDDEKHLEGIYEKMYNRFPDRLNVRVNYLDQLLEDRDFDKFVEICGTEQPDFKTIAGDKKTLGLTEYEQISEILVSYYMDTSDREKGFDYYEELRRIGGDYSYLRSKYFPEFINSLKEGQSIKVKDGYIEDSTAINMSGWQGRILNVDEEDDLIEVEWDSITLQSIDMKDIEQLIALTEDYDTYLIEATAIELVEPRDTQEDTEKAYNEIYLKVEESYKVKDFPYDMYDEIKNLNARNGRIFTEILSTLQLNRKPFDKLNFKKIAAELELTSSDIIKSIEELEKMDILKTFYSSVLKKDRERWIFVKSEKNYNLYNQLINKEISIMDLDKLSQEYK